MSCTLYCVLHQDRAPDSFIFDSPEPRYYIDGDHQISGKLT